MHFVWIFFAFLQFPRRQRHWPPPSPSPSFRPGQPTPLQTRSPSLGPPWTPETPVFQTGECGVEVDVLGVPWLVMISSKSQKRSRFFRGHERNKPKQCMIILGKSLKNTPLILSNVILPPPTKWFPHTPPEAWLQVHLKKITLWNQRSDIKSTQSTQLLVFKTSVSRGVITSGSS